MFARWIRNLSVFFAAAGLSAASSVCFAQFSANVQGTVTDPSGANVAGAKVVLHNFATNADSSTTTSAAGFYRFSSVAPGDYTVTASASGFEAAAVSLTVTSEETRGADIELRVAGSEVKVTVSAAATELNPEETRIQTTVGSVEISQLPLANRDVQEIIALTPGVTGFQNESPNNGYGSSIFAGNFNPNYHGNGLGTNSNLFLVDDLPVNDAQTQGQALILPNSETISQVSLQAQTYSVENGTSASLQTAYTTKSGSNAFHGAADYSYDSSGLGAAAQPSFGNTTAPTLLAPFHQNLFLASLGGPIAKNKTFFFGSIEVQRAAIGQISLDYPSFTPQFGQWALASFPASGAAQALVFTSQTRDVGNKITNAAQLGAGLGATCGTTQPVLANSALSYNLPCDLPVFGSGGVTIQSQPFNGINWNIRLDQEFRDGKDKVYGLYERIDQKLGNLAEHNALDGVTPSQNKYFSVNYIHLFNSKLLNEAHFGNLRAWSDGIPLNPASQSVPYLPIYVDGTGQGIGFTFPFGSTPFNGQVNKVHTYAFRDTVSYTLQSHSLSFGYQYSRGDVFQDASSIYSRPFVPVYVDVSFPPFLDFLRNDIISFASNAASPLGGSAALYTLGGSTGKYQAQLSGATSIFNSLFVQDSWKARPNLTLDYGLRYDDFGNPVSYGATAQPFAPLYPGAGATFQQQAWGTVTRLHNAAFTESQNWNFAPRAGFAYTPTRSKLTLVRGGIGLYYNAMTPYQISGNLPTQPPDRLTLNVSGPTPYGDFSSTLPNFGYQYSVPVYGTDPSGNIYSKPDHSAVYSTNVNGFAPKTKPEKILNYSLGLEQQFGAGVVFGLTYSGNYGYDLVYGSSAGGGGGTNSDSGANCDYNLSVAAFNTVGSDGKPAPARPTGEWGRICYGRNGLNSNFNEMIVTLRQTYKGMTYQANYNFAKALQDSPVSGDSAAGHAFNLWPGIYLPKAYYGPTQSDVRNSFSFGGAYEVPKVFQARWVNEAAAGWRLSALIVAQTGTPFSVLNDGTDYSGDGSNKFDGSGNGSPGLPTYSGTTRSGWKRSVLLQGPAGPGALNTKQFSDPVGAGTVPVQQLQGINSFRNPGYFTVNSGLGKAFSLPLPFLHEEGKFILRGEAINLLNRTNYQGIHNDVTDGQFGDVTTANQKRYIQIGGRIEF